MLISSLKIKNYRGLDINIDTIEKVSIIIGQNDSGKTNICSAIMKVLDYNKRRIPFILTDSTNSNKEDIEIEITLTADDLTKEQLALIGNYIHIKEKRLIKSSFLCDLYHFFLVLIFELVKYLFHLLILIVFFHKYIFQVRYIFLFLLI